MEDDPTRGDGQKDKIDNMIIDNRHITYYVYLLHSLLAPVTSTAVRSISANCQLRPLAAGVVVFIVESTATTVAAAAGAATFVAAYRAANRREGGEISSFDVVPPPPPPPPSTTTTTTQAS